MPVAPRFTYRPDASSVGGATATDKPTPHTPSRPKGVCEHLPSYDNIVCMPPKRFETKMLQALVGHEAFCKRAEGAAEAAVLVRDIRYLRYMCRRTRKNEPAELVLSVIGFSSVRERDLVLRLIRYGLQPRLIWAAEVGSDGSGKWEALLVLDVWRWPVAFVFGGREDLVGLIEKVLDSCRQSISVLELPSWTDPSTVTALQRLQAGRYKWGNLYRHMNRHFLLQHEVRVLSQEREAERARLREHTDLYFSADNMIYLLRELRAAHLALEQMRGALAFATNGVRELEVGMHDEDRELTELHAYLRAASVGPNATQMPQVEPRMQVLRDSLARQRRRAVQLQGVVNPALAETALRAPDVQIFSAVQPRADSQQPRAGSQPPPPPPDPLTSPPLGPGPPGLRTDAPAPRTNAPAPLPAVRFFRPPPPVSLRVLPWPPGLDMRVLDRVGGASGSGDSHDPIEVD